MFFVNVIFLQTKKTRKEIILWEEQTQKKGLIKNYSGGQPQAQKK